MKVIGVGVDLEAIGRFDKKTLNKDKVFYNKIFTKKEIGYCLSKRNKSQHFAARFSAKEAIVKALHDLGISFSDYKKIEILNDSKGVPRAKIHCKNINVEIGLSISHSNEFSLAFAIVSIKHN